MKSLFLFSLLLITVMLSVLYFITPEEFQISNFNKVFAQSEEKNNNFKDAISTHSSQTKNTDIGSNFSEKSFEKTIIIQSSNTDSKDKEVRSNDDNNFDQALLFYSSKTSTLVGNKKINDDYYVGRSHLSEHIKIHPSITHILEHANPKAQAKIHGATVENDQIFVYVYLAKDKLSKQPSNIEILAQDQNIIATKLSLPEILSLADLNSVEKITLPDFAVFRSHNSSLTEGVSFSTADEMHLLGFDGAGIKVAVIDDNFNITNSEISSNIFDSQLFNSSGTCIGDFPGDISCGEDVNASHGTAVAEIVVDMAPDVDLLLYSVGTSLDFRNAVDEAISNGADIITASLGFPTLGGDGTTGWYRDGTSSVAKKVDDAKNAGILFTVAAGNQGKSHWNGTYVANSTALLSPSTLNTKLLEVSGNSFFGYSSIENGTDGFPIISYFDDTNSDLKVVHCTNASCSTKDSPTSLDTTGNVGKFNSISIGSDGFPVISYYDTTNSALKFIHCTNESCSSFDAPIILDSDGLVGQYNSIAIGDDGFPVISYYDSTNEDLKVVHCTNLSCTTKDSPIALDSSGEVGSHSSIAIGADGFPVISYLDGTNIALKVVHCTNVSCSTKDTPTTLDGSIVGAFTSIAIGTDNLPIVSYYDVANSALKVVHCTNTSCTTKDTPSTLDSAETVGTHSSITIASDGFPVISYYDNSNLEVKVVHCTNTSCSGSDSPITLDSSLGIVGVVEKISGRYTSITTGADGFPVLSYLDYTNKDLKVVHCANNSCSSNDSPTTLASAGTVGYQSVMIFNDAASGAMKACLPVDDKGSSYTITWNDWDATIQDYDVLLFSSNMQSFLTGSFQTQNPSVLRPLEIFSWLDSGDSCLVIASYSSTQDHDFHVDVGGNDLDISYQIPSVSIDTPADATGALTVGAISFNGSPTDYSDDFLEVFSSQGPTEDGRLKPEICGPDRTFTHQTGLNPPQPGIFPGTSASTPHIAGAAALLLEQDSTLNVDQLRQKLIDNARFDSDFSKNNLCGSDVSPRSGSLSLSDTVVCQNVPSSGSWILEESCILKINSSMDNLIIQNDSNLIINPNITLDLSTSNSLSVKSGSSLLIKSGASLTFTGSFVPCLPPMSGNWTIDSDCTMVSSDAAPENVIVQNNALLTIPSGVTLDVDFSNFDLIIKSGGSILVKSGGELR